MKPPSRKYWVPRVVTPLGIPLTVSKPSSAPDDLVNKTSFNYAYRAVICASAGLTALLVCLMFGEQAASWTLHEVCIAASVHSLSMLAVVFWASPRGLWSAGCAFAVVFCVFHFGLTWSTALDPSLGGRRYARWMYYWFMWPEAKAAIVLTCIGLSACVAGIGAGSYRRKIVGSRFVATALGGDRAAWPEAGLAFVAVGTLSWFAMALSRGGVGILFASYEAFRSATENLPVWFSFLYVGAGMSCLAIAPPSDRASAGYQATRAGYALFAVWGVVVLLIGFRGEVMIPLVAYFVVAAQRRVLLSTTKTLMFGLCLLIVAAVVRDLRSFGISSADQAKDINASPLSSLMELGGSLRPVVEVINWSKQGESFRYGATYWAPFERTITLLVPLWDRPAAEFDDRIMNVVVAKRAGNIGFSVLAEGFWNFGLPGAIGVMALVGLLLGWMDRWASAPLLGAMKGVVMTELLFHVRNSFIGLPSQIVIAAGSILFVTWFLRRQQEGATVLAPDGAVLGGDAFKLRRWNAQNRAEPLPDEPKQA